MTTSANYYQSPLTTRYKNHDLSVIWSKKETITGWVHVWLQTLLDDHASGAIDLTDSQLATVKESLPKLDTIINAYFFDSMAQEESITKHDVVAALRTTEEFLGLQDKLHVGFTSSDVQDIVLMYQLDQSRDYIAILVRDLMVRMGQLCYTTGFDAPIPGYTHLQVAEPTTMKHRMCICMDQLDKSLEMLVKLNLPNPVPNGAVGTFSNRSMVHPELNPHYEDPYLSGQTYHRVEELRMLSILADFGAILAKLAIDLRFLYSTGIINQRNDEGQIGSSAMPSKVNPIGWEKVSSLARRLPAMYTELWHTSASSVLERTLDDSANRRSLLPEAFMVLAECLKTVRREVVKIKINAVMGRQILKNNWRVWVGSRAQTYLKTKGRHTMLDRLDEQLRDALTWQGFLAAIAPELLDKAEIESLYMLDYVDQMDNHFLQELSRHYLACAPTED